MFILDTVSFSLKSILYYKGANCQLDISSILLLHIKLFGSFTKEQTHKHRSLMMMV